MTTLGLIGVYLAVAASAGAVLLGLSRPGATGALRVCRLVALVACVVAFGSLTRDSRSPMSLRQADGALRYGCAPRGRRS